MKEYKNQMTIEFPEKCLYNNMDLLNFLKVGEKVIVYVDKNDLTGNQYFGIMEDNGEGIRHITNFLSVAYHGYRGTLCGISTYGHGLREIKKIIHMRDKEKNVVLKVVLGPDLVPDKP